MNARSIVLIFLLILIALPFSHAVTITDLNVQINNSAIQVQTLTAQISAQNQLLQQMQADLTAFEAKAITNEDMPAIFKDVDTHAAAAHQQIVTSSVVIVLLAFAIMGYGKGQKWW